MNTPAPIEHNAPRYGRAARMATPRPATFAARLTSWVAWANNNRWKYAWTQIVPDPALASSPYYTDGELSGTTSEGYAINLVELNNVAGKGVQSGGVDTTSDVAEVILQPIGGGRTSESDSSGDCSRSTPVQLTRRMTTDGLVYYTFALTNQVSVECD